MKQPQERICPECGAPSASNRTLLCKRCESKRRSAAIAYERRKPKREEAFAKLVSYANRPDVRAAIKASIRKGALRISKGR